MATIEQRLKEWCRVNSLRLLEVEPEFGLYSVDGLEGTFFLIRPENPEDDVIDEDFWFVLSDLEVDLIVESGVSYILFEFGNRFYYTPAKLKKNEFNDEGFEADFDDFKYIGLYKPANDVKWVHLGVHSEYELLNGAQQASLWCKKASFLSMPAIAIADKNTLAGTLAFQVECKKKGLKSILGITATIAVDYRADKEIQKTFEMMFYATNENGWQNLLQINKSINVDYNGFIPEEKLLELGDGVIAVFSTNSQLNFAKDRTDGIRLIAKYKSQFLAVFYQIDSVEFYDDQYDMDHLNKMQRYLNDYYKILPPVLINDSYYVEPEMFQLKEYLNKVDKKAVPYSEDQYFKTVDETINKLSLLFADKKYFDKFILSALSATLVIAGLCTYEINTGEHKLPKYEFIEGKTNEEHFFDLLQDGMERKLFDKVDDINLYMERIEKEASVIVNAGFIDYFLILWDIVGWAKSQDIFVGPGRGSICGCLLAYLLDITDVDPIKHDLLFERFLNEARVSGERAKAADAMPDVDVDFETESRDIVKAYIFERFGTYHTCSIGSYTRLKLKAGIKDFARAKGLDFAFVNYITKWIDQQLEYSWKDLFKFAAANKDLFAFVQKFPDIIHCIKYSLQQARSASIHASAVIIVPNRNKEGKPVDIFNWMPIRKMDGMLVSEWEGKYIDKAGFLKEDILGLNQLDKFKKTLQLISRNKNVDIVLSDIPLEDKMTYKLFQRGLNEDVFQFGSPGLKSYSKKVLPDCLEDLIAMNALYRPGPMDSNAHLDFALIKHGKKKAEYDYMLREVTENTQGLYVYQEQIMKAVTVLGNFSLVDADVLRTQIKKFDKVAMRASEDKFIKGAIDNGCSPAESKKVWDKLVAFSGYGFNKSHSAAYTLIAYWTQWLKANYPLEFWTSSMNFVKHESYLPERISEMKRLKQGLQIKAPSLNHSNKDFDCNDTNMTIYWSLSKIKGLGEAKVNAILEARENGGNFYSYEDFVGRVPKKVINKATVETLIIAGAFDDVESVINPVERLNIIEQHYKRLGEAMPDKYQTPAIKKQYHWIQMQKALTGYGDVDYSTLLAQNKQFKKYSDKYMEGEKVLECKRDYTEAFIAGEVSTAVLRKAKSGKCLPFMTFTITCNNTLIGCVAWNDFYAPNQEFIDNFIGKTVGFYGKIKYDDWAGQNRFYSFDNSVIFEL